MKKRILITGGAGFIGHHFVKEIIKNTHWDIVILDKLNYASEGFDRLRDIDCFDDKRVLTLTVDFSREISDGVKREIGEVDYIAHIGAESHVDNSILNPEPFIMSNVVGTMHILNFARELKNLKRMVYMSTDEVFGPAPKGTEFKEWDRYNSTNPYSATKAGAEELCLAYANAYKLPVFIVHCMNTFGERQHPEKFVPMCVKRILEGKTVIIHADETKTIPGSRFWIHAKNVSSAILFLLERAEVREKYNIVGEKEVDNLTIAKKVSKILKKKLKYKLIDFHSSRPGHDLRYSLCGERMRKMGWRLPVNFEESLKRTINWIVDNPKWLKLNDNNKND